MKWRAVEWRVVELCEVLWREVLFSNFTGTGIDTGEAMMTMQICTSLIHHTATYGESPGLVGSPRGKGVMALMYAG